ncbi:GiOR-1 [Giardia muris]|uniref:GiOR-1 n=1 Tax=Giardia muris TaxID=5742 RepID=A0A4Z1SL74_GIAMU|nr:GiOR-1 [Giardia muris]|eukprot:TNJ26240.1 GiOR-1 [Giardia muris]
MSTRTLSVIYSSGSGNTKRLAENVTAILREHGIHTALHDAKTFKHVTDLPVGNILYLTSTRGVGHHPQASKALMNSIRQSSSSALSGRHVAVLGVGSLRYPKFCAASRDAAELFRRHGAETLLTPVHFDQHEVDIGIRSWIRRVLEKCGTSDAKSMRTRRISVKLSQAHPQRIQHMDTHLVHLKAAHALDSSGWVYTLTIPQTMACQLFPGAHVAISPRLDERIVEEILGNGTLVFNEHQLRGADVIQVSGPTDLRLPHAPCTVLDLLCTDYDLTRPPTPDLIRTLGQYAQTDLDRFKLSYFSVDDATSSILLSQWPTIRDFLLEFRELRIPLSVLLETVPRIKPRLYSVASMPRRVERGWEVDLIVSNNPAMEESEGRYVSCVSYLKRLLGKQIAISIHDPDSHIFAADRPMLGVSAGSGYAPFRALLHHRREQKALGKCLPPLLLFVSFKMYDQMLGTELQEAVRDGLTSVVLAITRNEYGLTDVTDFMSPLGTSFKVIRGRRLDRETILSLLPLDFLSSDAHVSYCGGTSGLIGELHQALRSRLGDSGYARLVDGGRLHIEAY